MKGLLLCRVSTERQMEGQSLNAQLRVGQQYAKSKGITIVRTWEIGESASKEDRKQFYELCDYAKKHREIGCILVEKEDRLTRDFWNTAEIRDLIFVHEKQIHFFLSGYVVDKDINASTFVRLGIGIVLSTHGAMNLKQETIKGLEQKARSGEWPCHAPCGYKNNKLTHKVREFDRRESHWVQRAFELMESGLYTLDGCRAKLFEEGCPRKLLPWKSSIEKWIRNPFYYGWFQYRGVIYEGRHPQLVSRQRWDHANAALSRLGKPFRRQQFPYGGLMHCAACRCTITAERHKGKYDFYRCTWGKGKCANTRYFPAKEIERRLAEALGKVHIDRELADWIVLVLTEQADEITGKIETKTALLKSELNKIKGYQTRAFKKMLDGDITEEFWKEESSQWTEDQSRTKDALLRLESTSPAAFMPTARNILELANSLPSLLFSMEPEKRRFLLNLVLLNLMLDVETLHVQYQKPFDLLAKMPQNKEWGPRRDRYQNQNRNYTRYFSVLRNFARPFTCLAWSKVKIPPKTPWLYNNLICHNDGPQSWHHIPGRTR